MKDLIYESDRVLKFLLFTLKTLFLFVYSNPVFACACIEKERCTETVSVLSGQCTSVLHLCHSESSADLSASLNDCIGFISHGALSHSYGQSE